MAPGRRRFVEWEEHFVSHDRGSRVVHYYAKDDEGIVFLAVVGTERSIRHMVYVVSEEFLQLVEVGKSTNSSFKWRARREVVDWLTSLLSKPNGEHSKSPTWEGVDQRNYFYNSKGNFSRKLQATGEDIVWLGSSWTCGKRLRHYQSFCRNGSAISVHAFVYVMAEENQHHIAYLEDMYEDKKLRKKVKVRWFHKTEEVVGTIPPPSPHAREVFITPFSQVLSAECVGGQATILTSEHYEKCLVKLPFNVAAQTYLCSRQFDNDGIKPFNLTELHGYFNQKVFATIDLALPQDSSKHDLATDSFDMEEEEDAYICQPIKRGSRRHRSSRRRLVVPDHYCVGNAEATIHVSEDLHRLTACGGADRDQNNSSSERRPLLECLGENRKQGGAYEQGSVSFDIGDQVELLCQDSGIRGCWFRCMIIRNLPHQLKVRYEDLWNEDGGSNLEEWVPAFRIAAPDKLGMRISGRPTIRPCPENGSFNNFEVGTAVDAWWNDGWWEGVVVMINEIGGGVQVYFPGENDCLTFQRANLRISRDWIGNKWVDVKEKDLASDMISLDSNKGAGTGCLQSTAFSKISTASLASAEVGSLVNCLDWKLPSPYLQAGVRESRELLMCESPKNAINTERRIESTDISCEDGICMKINTSGGTFASAEHDNGVDIISGQSKSVKSVHGVQCTCDVANDGLRSDLKWKSSRKRQRTGGSSFLSRAGTSCGKQESERFPGGKMMGDDSMKNGEQLASNTKDLGKRHENNKELGEAKMLSQGPEKLKSSIGNSLFMGSMRIANLVMSR